MNRIKHWEESMVAHTEIAAAERALERKRAIAERRAKLEAEYFGDPDAETGIYDTTTPRCKTFQIT